MIFLKNKLIKLYIVIFFCFLIKPTLFAGDFSFLQDKSSIVNRGVWVSVFSPKEVLYSKDAANKLIEDCKRYNLNEIYLQVYRAGTAFYDTTKLPRQQYEKITQISGIDIIDYLIDEASKNGIKIFAWINVLSLSQNKDADVLKQFDDSILTCDQYSRTPLKENDDTGLDKYYLRENQLFLEPGDKRVSDYIILVVDEIMKRYPKLSGIHLDYMRYPYCVPYNPSSKFGNFGLNYGYGKGNTEVFKEKTGLDAFSLKDNDEYLKWDNWRRDQVSDIVKKISKHVKENSPGMLLSCAVISSSERAYSVTFQDWPSWLENGIIDYAVLMNYTKDNQLAKEILASSLSLKSKAKIYNGMGIFLLKDDLGVCRKQYEIIESLNPDGIIFFSYDDLF